MPRAFTQYQYRGQFISEGRAHQLSSLKHAAQYVTSFLRTSHTGPAVLKETGYFDRTELRTKRAMKSDQEARSKEWLRESKERQKREELPELKAPVYPHRRGTEKEPAPADIAGFPRVLHEDFFYDDMYDELFDVADIDDQFYLED